MLRIELTKVFRIELDRWIAISFSLVFFGLVWKHLNVHDLKLLNQYRLMQAKLRLLEAEGIKSHELRMIKKFKHYPDKMPRPRPDLFALDAD